MSTVLWGGCGAYRLHHLKVHNIINHVSFILDLTFCNLNMLFTMLGSKLSSYNKICVYNVVAYDSWFSLEGLWDLWHSLSLCVYCMCVYACTLKLFNSVDKNEDGGLRDFSCLVQMAVMHGHLLFYIQCWLPPLSLSLSLSLSYPHSQIMSLCFINLIAPTSAVSA